MISHDARRVDNSNHFICLMSQLLLATIVTNYVLTDKESDDSVILHTRFLKQYFPLANPQNLINCFMGVVLVSAKSDLNASVIRLCIFVSSHGVSADYNCIQFSWGSSLLMHHMADKNVIQCLK